MKNESKGKTPKEIYDDDCKELERCCRQLEELRNTFEGELEHGCHTRNRNFENVASMLLTNTLVDIVKFAEKYDKPELVNVRGINILDFDKNFQRFIKVAFRLPYNKEHYYMELKRTVFQDEIVMGVACICAKAREFTINGNWNDNDGEENQKKAPVGTVYKEKK